MKKKGKKKGGSYKLTVKSEDPLAKNVLLVSLYSEYSLYNFSSISANVSLPEHGIA